jgi:hypothetical protein
MNLEMLCGDEGLLPGVLHCGRGYSHSPGTQLSITHTSSFSALRSPEQFCFRHSLDCCHPL